MRFQTQLVPATLERRYKRFLADCTLDNKKRITAHCPNPGSMMGLADPGSKIWLEPNNNPKKKLKYGWRIVDHENGHYTGIDTSLPNHVIKDALADRSIPSFTSYDIIRPEVPFGDQSRIDFLLTAEGLPDTFIEVKSVTLSRIDTLAEFPDSVTKRGTRHLYELKKISERGHRAVLLFLVQRTDCSQLKIADDIDPDYAEAITTAQRAGVEVLSLSAHITPVGIEIGDSIDFQG
ncbi:MAG: DNA/RNA nuclease SfsA [Aestuariivita sp.]|nr:DNA/RNA nuclease SfsA [Aestuariivita sp.]